MQFHDIMSVLSVPHQKKRFLPHIGGVRIVGDNSHLTPWLALTLPLTKHGYRTCRRTQYTYMHIHHHLSPMWHACAALHTLQELIHILRKRPQDISRSPCFMCVVASRTTDTQPLPHDRDCPQVSLVLRGRVWNSHHPARGNLHSYLVIDALL
jgi:hypothetical protein